MDTPKLTTGRGPTRHEQSIVRAKKAGVAGASKKAREQQRTSISMVQQHVVVQVHVVVYRCIGTVQSVRGGLQAEQNEQRRRESPAVRWPLAAASLGSPEQQVHHLGRLAVAVEVVLAPAPRRRRRRRRRRRAGPRQPKLLRGVARQRAQRGQLEPPAGGSALAPAAHGRRRRARPPVASN